MKANSILFLVLFTFFGIQSQAKRQAPSEIKPLIRQGIEYSVPHFSVFAEGMKHNGGYVEAKNLKTKKRVWMKEIYPVVYDKNLESDVQDIFITSMQLKGRNLIIIDDYGRDYKVLIKK